MTMMQSNVALIKNIPEERQEDIYNYLVMNYINDSPIKPRSGQQIKDELSLSREDARNGNYRDFDEFMDDLEARYEL